MGAQFDYKLIPGAQGVMDEFSNFDPRGNKVGLGQWGKLNRGVLGDVGAGKLDQNQYYNQAVVNPIKSYTAGERSLSDRNMTLDPSLQSHPELMKNIQASQGRGITQQGQEMIGKAGQGFVQGAGQAFQGARNDAFQNTMGFNKLRLDALGQKANTLLGGTRGPTRYTPGIGSQIAGFAAQGLGGLI